MALIPACSFEMGDSKNDPEDWMEKSRPVHTVTYMDERLGRLLDALDETGLRERTAVVYTSDHGELLGEHGMWYKSSFYEQSVRIPLIISWPGKLPRRRVKEVVSLVDLTATIVELAGAPRLDWMDGDSLLSLAKGRKEANCNRQPRRQPPLTPTYPYWGFEPPNVHTDR